MPSPTTIAEYDRPDVSTFREEIYPAARPAILRGLGADLEAVQLAQKSTAQFAQFMKGIVGSDTVKVLSGKPDAGSTFFFEGDVSSYNFDRTEMPFTQFVDRLIGENADDGMLFIEAKKVAELSLELASALALPFAPNGVEPLLWMGNRTGVQTHFDHKQNIAYVVSGRRRFTLFPPDQTPNLYMAPFERSPSGAPVSMVRLDDPDYERFPRFREAEKHAMVAELAPGDALFIPYMWWHQVQALGDVNLLVNYWWNEYEVLGEPMPAMLHSMLAIRDLPPPMRAAWQSMFETFVFKVHGEPMDYIEPEMRGGMGPLSGSQRGELWHSVATFVNEFVQRIMTGGRP